MGVAPLETVTYQEHCIGSDRKQTYMTKNNDLQQQNFKRVSASI